MSRHIRRLKSYRQIKDGTNLDQQEQQQQQSQHQQQQDVRRGAVRCEICQVTVNSSHQLQAHLEGKIGFFAKHFIHFEITGS